MIRLLFLATLALAIGFALGLRVASALESPLASCSRHAIIPSDSDPRVHWLAFWPSQHAEGVVKAEGTPEFVRLMFDAACAEEERIQLPAYARWPAANEKLMGE